jgi:anti-sigma factor RsiW
MKCSDYVLMISRRFDGSLTEDETARLEAHLAGCARCRTEAIFQERLIRALKQEIPATLPRDFTRRVTREAEGMARMEIRRKLGFADLVPAFLAAAAAMVLVVFSGEIGPWLASAMQWVGGTVGASLGSLGEPVSNLLARGATLGEAGRAYPGTVSHLAGNLYFGLTLSLAVAAWALSRAYAFMRR